MARISTYPIDSTPSVEDMVIGTEVDNLDVTKNYRIGDLLALGGNGTVTDIALSDGSVTGTSITISGVFTFLGTGGITTTVSGTTMTIDGSGISAGVTQITAGTNITVNPAAGTGVVEINSTDQYEGTVTNVAYTTNINAFTANVSNPGVSPVITLNLNGGSAGQFLQQDGNWATVPGGSSGVTSVGLSAPSAFTVSNSPVTGIGVLILAGAGATTDYIDGTGSLQSFPTIPSVPTNIVETVDTTDGGFIALTPVSPASGNVVITADLSAVDGTDTSGLFLSKDNLWSAPPGGSGGVTQIVAGTNVTVSPVGGTGTVTINSTDQFTGTVTGVTGVLPITSSGGTTPAIGINNYTGADGTTAGTKGAVPAPGATDNVKFLKGDGTWADAGGTGTVISITPVADSGTGTAITTIGDITFTGAGGITTSVNSSNEVTITGSGGGSGLWTTVGTDIYNNNYLTGGAVIGKNTAASDTTAALEVSGRISQVDLNNGTFIGFEAGKDNTALGNTGLGYHSLKTNTSGERNTALGADSLKVNTSGSYNASLGYSSLQANTTGQSNTSIGFNSLFANTIGNANTSVGRSSMNLNTSGDDNTAVGVDSLTSNTTGDQNTAVGHNTLETNTTGTYNTALGVNAVASSANATNQIIIGYNAVGTGDNTVTIGNTSITATHLKGILVLDDAGGTPDATTFLRGDNSWAVPAGGGSTNPAGSDTQVQYNDSSAFGAGAFFTTNKSSKVDVKYELGLVGDTINQGLLKLYCEAGTAHFVGIKGPNHSGANSYTLQLPNTLPNATNQILESDATGTLSWIPTPSGGGTYTAGTGLTLSGTAFNANVDGTQTVTPNASSATALRTYNVQVDSNDDLVVNVPWLNDNDDTGITAVTLAQGTSTGATNVLEESITGRTLTLTSNKYAGGDFAGYVPIGGDATTFLRGDGTWQTTGVTTYDLASSQDGDNVDITLTPSAGAVDTVQLTAGTGIALTNNSNSVTIDVLPGNNGAFVPVGNSLTNSDIYNANFDNTSTTARSVIIGDDNMSDDVYANLEVHGRVSQIVGQECTLFGKLAGAVNTGISNSAFGFEALKSNIGGTINTAIGQRALNANTTGFGNTAVGGQSLLLNTTGYNNTAIGVLALKANIGGFKNTAIGISAMQSNTTGSENISFGYLSLSLNNGSENIAIGNQAFSNNVLNTGVVGIGHQVGRWCNPTDAVMIGNKAGYSGAAGGNLSGAILDSIFIGHDVKPLLNDSTNEIIIGSDAVGKGDNTVVLGNDSITETHLKGVVVLEGYTYAQLIALTAVVGMKAYRTDVGIGPHLWGSQMSSTTGTVVLPVFYDGSNWIYA